MIKGLLLAVCLGVFITPALGQGVTGDDADRVSAQVKAWKIDAMDVAEASKEPHANALANYLVVRGVPVLPLESPEYQAVTLRVSLPEESPQISVAPVRPEDTTKGLVWDELYRLNVLSEYSPSLRLLKVKDVPCTSRFIGLCLLSRMEEAKAYSAGEHVTLDMVLIRQVNSMKYFEKLSQRVYGLRLIGWIKQKEKMSSLLRFPNGSDNKYSYELDSILGPALSPDERADRQRQVYFWLCFNHLSRSYTGHALESAEVEVLKKSYTLL